MAIIPTSIQRLQFVADQVTQEKVGVKVTGIAVYRVAEPLIAFRMLNFSFPERAQEKLASDARVEEQRLAQERAIKAAQLAAEREQHLSRIAVQQELRQRQALAERAAALEKLQNEAALQQEKLRAEMEVIRLRAEQDHFEHQARLAKEAQTVELLRAQAEAAEARRVLAEIEARTVELEVLKQQHLARLELERAQKQREIENTVSPEVIQLAIANKLPELAQAFQQKMGEVHVTAVDGANPFGYIAAAVEGVLGLTRSAGLTPPKAENSKE